MAHEIPPLVSIAHDRIQQAGTRSPFIIGDIVLVYELCREGIRMRANRGQLELVRVISWRDIAMMHVDPLMEHHERMLQEIAKPQEACHAGG